MNIDEVKTKYSQLIKDINFDCLDLEHKTELLQMKNVGIS